MFWQIRVNLGLYVASYGISIWCKSELVLLSSVEVMLSIIFLIPRIKSQNKKFVLSSIFLGLTCVFCLYCLGLRPETVGWSGSSSTGAFVRLVDRSPKSCFLT